ncbi:unnamed protein product [Meloidogyne enterolobii]|uniref:Uncharacterized protein n=1 Tax=Meloidogyne enterolobii TaxID=390850 RepID=A0ACB1AGD4_MELEN
MTIIFIFMFIHFLCFCQQQQFYLEIYFKIFFSHPSTHTNTYPLLVCLSASDYTLAAVNNARLFLHIHTTPIFFALLAYYNGWQLNAIACFNGSFTH